MNCTVGHISLLQTSLEPTNTVASINNCFKILLFPFQSEFSYFSAGLLFLPNNLRKENEKLLMKQAVKRTKTFCTVTLLETKNYPNFTNHLLHIFYIKEHGNVYSLGSAEVGLLC